MTLRGWVAGVALGVFGLGAPALAQGTCPGTGGTGMMQGGYMAGAGSAPCQRLNQIATQQVENTSQGAVVTITANDPNQVSEVQQLVQSCPRFGTSSSLQGQQQGSQTGQQGLSPEQQGSGQEGQP